MEQTQTEIGKEPAPVFLVERMSGPQNFRGDWQAYGLFVSTTPGTPGTWYNLAADDESEAKTLHELAVKNGLGAGAKIRLQTKGRFIVRAEVVEKAPAKSFQKGKDEMTDLAELLDKAHAQGLVGIETTLVSSNFEPGKENVLFKAIVVMQGKPNERARAFSGHGDATPRNVGQGQKDGSDVSPHWVRVGESRAIARALRWATNDARVSEEELKKPEAPEAQESTQTDGDDTA